METLCEENEAIKQAIEKAFLPYACKVIFQDWDNWVAFEVFDKNNKLIIKNGKSKSELLDNTIFMSYLQNLRNFIEDKGLKLHSWP